ncbi:hypothetical protein ACLOJK_020914 [Asimina triloba]
MTTWNKRRTWSELGTRKECGNSCKVEASLARARAAIRESSLGVNPTSSALTDPDYVPRGPMYRNAKAFHRSYIEMEKVFRIFVYEEGEPPLFHDGPCKSIYSSEGRFIYGMDMESQLRTRNPDHAHAYFLPFSITKMIGYLREAHNRTPIKKTVADYIEVISRRYPYWNQSLGADHFMLSCHDSGPFSSAANPYLYHNSIRVLCNANTSEGFNPSKDASLPEINLKTGIATKFIGGPSPSRRSILGFFAGGVHGPIRPVLLKHWKNKDGDLRVYEYLPKSISYHEMMKKSKFCICPSGYEVASPRIVEAIYAECVPVIISEGYVLPFSDVLNWKSFSVHVSVSEIPNLKDILLGISQQQYIRMQRRVKQVQRHFVVNTPPKRFDVFHMVIHSVWLRRLNGSLVLCSKEKKENAVSSVGAAPVRSQITPRQMDILKSREKFLPLHFKREMKGIRPRSLKSLLQHFWQIFHPLASAVSSSVAAARRLLQLDSLSACFFRLVISGSASSPVRFSGCLLLTTSACEFPREFLVWKKRIPVIRMGGQLAWMAGQLAFVLVSCFCLPATHCLPACLPACTPPAAMEGRISTLVAVIIRRWRIVIALTQNGLLMSNCCCCHS